MTNHQVDDPTERHRERIWEELRKVARPDSRFHWDFSRFITDFEGSDRCAEQVLDLDVVTALNDRRIFIAPDNCLEELRYRLIRAGVPFIMTTYGIVRGFQAIDPAEIAPEDARYAATLDGFDRFARPVSLRELAAGPPFGMCVTGGSAVSRNGVRFGKGHGYFDFEFAVLSELGVADDTTRVIDVVHDCQYVDDDLEAKAHDVAVDTIVTPTRTLDVAGVRRPPAHIHWDLLPGTEFEVLGIVDELRTLQAPKAP
ncbi:MAG: 5-formyltetrahydrofolate cyclo-ligase [Streptosporangiaceae bacterium]|jgi:5-formyltetrahydrofolate cyclo-ligase|nr:5-formyltetrahydrofolate cyclo-ligase [Streptosporangiaceae bacterium]